MTPRRRFRAPAARPAVIDGPAPIAARQAVADMLSSLAMPDAEVDRRLAVATDPRYWRRLAPALSLEGPARRLHAAPLNARQSAADLTAHGYVQLGQLLQPRIIKPMVAAVEKLRAADWPAVFAFLYDEFWLAPRAGGIPAFLRQTLGPDCDQSANVWLHYVEARRGAAGWPPHRDHTDPGRVTMWIPLTPATVEDGCISVLPSHLVPAHLAGSWERIDTMSRDDVLRLLHAARPLPAPAGSVVCWHTGVLHWGGHRTNATRPRVAFSMEFRRSSAGAGDAEDALPAVPLAGPLPSFAERLRLVARMVLLYYPNEPRAARYVELCRRLAGPAPREQAI